MTLLFLCVANSARSQMAEGLARDLFGDQVTVLSAGSQATYVHPFAIKALEEFNIDISGQRSKAVSTIDPKGVDMVITLCADEVCPATFSKAEHRHWPMLDPGFGAFTPNDVFRNFCVIRDEILIKLKELSEEFSGKLTGSSF